MPPAFLAHSQPSAQRAPQSQPLVVLSNGNSAAQGRGEAGASALLPKPPHTTSAALPLPLSLTPWSPTCDPPTLHHATPTANTTVFQGGELALADGTLLHVALPVLTECVLSSVLLTPLSPAAYFASHSLEDPGLEVTLTMCVHACLSDGLIDWVARS